MVAAGGAGTGKYLNSSLIGGAGGGLIGYSGNIRSGDYSHIHEVATGGSQTSYGVGSNLTCNSKFGHAVDACDKYGTGGVAGYYGGGSGLSTFANVSSGAGGSSFISGHNGCDAIKKESTEDNIIHTGESIHYSGLYFTNTVMIDGNGYNWTTEKGNYLKMPSHVDNTTMTGNHGNGFARITMIFNDN